MKKRPYSTDFTPRGNPRQYRLAHIPPGMWAAAQARAKRQGLSMRALLLHLIQTWLESDENSEEVRDLARQLLALHAAVPDADAEEDGSDQHNAAFEQLAMALARKVVSKRPPQSSPVVNSD